MHTDSTDSKVYYCPECGSPSVSIGALSGSTSVCASCAWEGKSTDLVVGNFSQEHGSEEAIFKAINGDLRLLLASTMAKPFAAFLSKWGFMYGDGEVLAKQLGRYLAAAARAVLESMLTERAKMEKERVSGN